MVTGITLSEAADLAGIVTGVAALALSVVLGLQAYSQHRAATRRDVGAELTDVLTELAKLSSGFYVGDENARMAFYQQHGMSARYLAFRADRLLGELPASDLNSFELGMIAQAFFLNAENDKAEAYFDQAFGVAFAQPCLDRSATLPVRLSLLRSRAECMFALNRQSEGRTFYERAIDLNADAGDRSDASVEADIWAILGWSNCEFGLANVEHAEQLLVRAEALVPTLQVPWRRARQQYMLDQARAVRIQMAMGAPPVGAVGPAGGGPDAGPVSG